MAYLSSSLNIIRGYTVGTGKIEKSYIVDAYFYDNVITSLSLCFKMLGIKYDVDISTERANLESEKWGPRIRSIIRDTLLKISNAAGIKISLELSLIKNAHYGRDMREPLFDALVKLGAEGDFYIKTPITDYIYQTTQSGVILLYYKGEHHAFIEIPAYAGTEESPIAVIGISPFLFSDNEELMGVKIPGGVQTMGIA